MTTNMAMGDGRWVGNMSFVDNTVRFTVGDQSFNTSPRDRWVAPSPHSAGGVWNDNSIYIHDSGMCHGFGCRCASCLNGNLNDLLKGTAPEPVCSTDGHQIDPESIETTTEHLVGVCLECGDTIVLPVNPAQRVAAVVAELIAALGTVPEGWLEKFDAATLALAEAREQIEDAYALIELANTKLKEKVSS